MIMTHNFCTLFDKNYLYRGLALHSSLLEHCPDFFLFILCLDDETQATLSRLNLKNVRLVSSRDIESPELLAARQNRTRQEYAWTLGSFFTNYVLENNAGLPSITYLDSDIYFYSSPQALFDELGEDSVLIIRHNYEERLRYLEHSGLYNVALVIFKNDGRGSAVLKKWRDDVLAWCYNRHEDGKFGDQMYLDKWTSDWTGVCVSQHPGADLAPWNLNRYRITAENGKILVDGRPLVFYHTHTLKMIAPDRFELYSSFYRLPEAAVRLIYDPYTDCLRRAVAVVRAVDPNFQHGYRAPESFRDKLRQRLKRLLVTLYFSHKRYG